MKWIIGLVLAACTLAWTPQGALAAGGENTVAFDQGQPTSPAAGKVSGTGSYTEGGAYRLDTIVLIATNPKGGPGGQVTCMINRPTKTFSGTIPGLPTGTYSVFARGTFTAAGMPDVIFDTPHVNVAVK